MFIAIIACILIGICEPLLITDCSVLEKFEVYYSFCSFYYQQMKVDYRLAVFYIKLIYLFFGWWDNGTFTVYMPMSHYHLSRIFYWHTPSFTSYMRRSIVPTPSNYYFPPASSLFPTFVIFPLVIQKQMWSYTLICFLSLAWSKLSC